MAGFAFLRHICKLVHFRIDAVTQLEDSEMFSLIAQQHFFEPAWFWALMPLAHQLCLPRSLLTQIAALDEEGTAVAAAPAYQELVWSLTSFICD